MIVRIYASLAAICFLTISSCTKQETYPEPLVLEKSDQKEIISIAFIGADSIQIASSDIYVNVENDTFYISFPYVTDLNNLVPKIAYKGMQISPASGIAQDFSQPVDYTVTAEDSTTKKFVVVASIRAFRALYFGSSNGHLYALNPDNGSIIWDNNWLGTFTYSNPVIYGKTLYAGSGSTMHAIDPMTGQSKWQYHVGFSIESPAMVHKGILYFGSNDGKITAIDARTGEHKWHYQTLGNVSTRGVFYNNTVIFGSSDGGVYALDTLGELRWKYTMGDMANQSSPAVHNGVVFIGSRDGNLYGINANNGLLKWKFSDGPYSMEMSSPVVYDNKVYIGSWYDVSDFSKPGSLYAIDEETGALVWKKLDNIGIGADPYIHNDKLYISPDDAKFYALHAQTGETLWSKTIAPNGARAAAGNGTVYVGGGGSWNFYAFDEETGAEKWKLPTPDGMNTSDALLIE